MTAPLFPHAATIELLSEHLAARSAQAAECYRLATASASNGAVLYAAQLRQEARMHAAKADSYRASMMALTQPTAPARRVPPPGPEVPVPDAHVTITPPHPEVRIGDRYYVVHPAPHPGWGWDTPAPEAPPA